MFPYLSDELVSVYPGDISFVIVAVGYVPKNPHQVSLEVLTVSQLLKYLHPHKLPGKIKEHPVHSKEVDDRRVAVRLEVLCLLSLAFHLTKSAGY
jgi:hypothetical protein